jgi:hypothetical protein
VFWDVKSNIHNVTGIRASGVLQKCTEELPNRYIDTFDGSLPIQSCAYNTFTICVELIWIKGVDGEGERLRNRLENSAHGGAMAVEAK